MSEPEALWQQHSSLSLCVPTTACSADGKYVDTAADPDACASCAIGYTAAPYSVSCKKCPTGLTTSAVAGLVCDGECSNHELVAKLLCGSILVAACVEWSGNVSRNLYASNVVNSEDQREFCQEYMLDCI